MINYHQSFKDLPSSILIEELELKCISRRDNTRNYLAILDEFRVAVSQEVRHINELFPEYTPHDEYYHLSKLFFIADKLIPVNVIRNLNSSELLILCLSLYGHDWGMAVSEPERKMVTTNIKQTSSVSNSIALLPNEYEKFKEFEKEFLDFHQIDELVCWREYVRKTHAFRSGERIRKYFEKINAGLGEAVARVCEGHWLNFNEIQDHQGYPTNFTVLGETVNLRALAVYLRLIDILDLTEDRTPYIIWKFVAANDERSKLEWEKHRAIFSISFPEFQGGRIIQVDGSTSDNNVFSSLLDLKNWVEDQLKGCNEILNGINDTRYNLDVFNLNWRIQARGFKPISVQFEFDRSKMFEVLSDQIYQGDKYVFLRELLQNAIDAIRLRKELLAGVGLAMNKIGTIQVEVQHHENGDFDIVFVDDGIGMDEYIIKNYLSVAGKSYYNSNDYKKLGIHIDPISKFGVGLLSCFMVADEIEIETL